MHEVQPTASLVFVSADRAKDAILESINAKMPLIVSVAEGVPVQDELLIHAALQEPDCITRLVGPNCPGIINPKDRVRIGIMPHLATLPGCIGIIAKSGTLSYEAIGSTTAAGLGQTLSIGVGGDTLPGTTFIEGLELLLHHSQQTRAICLIGEIGGHLEFEAAGYIKKYYAEGGTKPIVAFVAGLTGEKGRVHGHAGAIWRYEGENAAKKIAALHESGCRILKHVGEAGSTLQELLDSPVQP